MPTQSVASDKSWPAMSLHEDAEAREDDGRSEPLGFWARLPTAAIFDDALSGTDVRVLAALSSYADRVGRCFPSVGAVANRLKLSRRQVQLSIRSLEDAGHIKTSRKIRDRGGWGPSVYQIKFQGVGKAENKPADEVLGAGGGHPSGRDENLSAAKQGAIELDAKPSSHRDAHGRPATMRNSEADDAKKSAQSDANHSSPELEPSELDPRTKNMNLPIHSSSSARGLQVVHDRLLSEIDPESAWLFLMATPADQHHRLAGMSRERLLRRFVEWQREQRALQK